MGFKVALIFFSLSAVLISIYLSNVFDNETKQLFYLKAAVGTFEFLAQADFILNSVGINGFYRTAEYGFSEALFYLSNRTDLNVEVRTFDGVEVVLFDPVKQPKNRPAIIFFHGGGWAYFTAKIYSTAVAEFARRLNLLIISVNYRKAPEHEYPIPFQDCLTATRYVFLHANSLKIDRDRIGLMGDSAGGNLVLTVGYYLSHLVKQGKGYGMPKVLIPLSPTLQMADTSFPSIHHNANDVTLKRDHVARAFCLYAMGQLSLEDMAKCHDTVLSNSHVKEDVFNSIKDNLDWKRYLSTADSSGPPAGRSIVADQKVVERFSKLVVEPTFSPLSALNNSQLAILPTVYLFAFSLDPLKDDAQLLAYRLNEIGRPLNYHEMDYYHAPYIFSFFGLQGAYDAIDKVVETLKNDNIP